MIYDIQYSSSGSRLHILKHIVENSLRTIDIGGATSFAEGCLNAVADINKPKVKGNFTFFQGNLNMPSIWDNMVDYVNQKGRFDFAICTHTIEDLCNPAMVLSRLPIIAKSGYIAVPSKYTEFSRIGEKFRGFIHHLHIFDIQNEVLIGYPKINYIEDEVFDPLGNQEKNLSKSELSFWWKDSIPFKLVNEGFLGPTVDDVKGYYQQLLDK